MAVTDISALTSDILADAEATNRKWSYRRAVLTWVGVSAIVWAGFVAAAFAVL